jgi:hypothetical protein
MEVAHELGPQIAWAGGQAHAPCLSEVTHAAMRRVLEEDTAQVVVGAAAPFAMLGSNAAFFELMGHWANGSALKILHGPTTRVDALETAMRAAANSGGGQTCHVCLYTASCLPRLLRVEVQFVQGMPQGAREEDKIMLVSVMPASRIIR